MNEAKTQTGYPSIDKPWLKYYSEEAIKALLPEGTVYDYLWKNNKDHPHDTAIMYFNTKITYGQLFSRIDRTERALRAFGVAAGDIVTISMPATPEVVYLFYALCKLGAVANMIDPRADADGLCRYLQEAESKLYFYLDRCKPIVDEALPHTDVNTAVSVSPTESIPFLRVFSRQSKTVNGISWGEFLRSGRNEHQPENTVHNASAPMLMTHTSGTTGAPKGVVLSNHNINAVAHQYEVKISHERGQRYLCVIPPFIAFGVCVAIHMPITLGVAPVLIPQFNSADFSKLLRKYKPEHFVCTPSNYESLLGDNSNIDLSFLLSPGAGGDSMEIGYEKNVNDYLAKHGCKSGVLKGYGMTEVSSTSCLCWPDCSEIGSVGIPLVNMTLSVFEIGTSRELTYGKLGEICFTGSNVMQGYYKNPEATATILKKHEDGKLWVHSGDVGYMTQDGMVYVVDRLKRSVDVDGHRVFPSTIESVILKCADVKKCAVSGDKTGSLTAFVVTLDGCVQADVKDALAKRCAAELPDYSLPTEYIFCKNLPLTPVGKVDFMALKQMAAADVATHS